MATFGIGENNVLSRLTALDFSGQMKDWEPFKAQFSMLHAKMTARGCKQEAGEHCEETGVSSPVANKASIFITLTLILIARMHAESNGMHGAFLEGLFSHGENHT